MNIGVHMSLSDLVSDLVSSVCMPWSGALGRPSGMGWGERLEGGSGWGTHVSPWLIHINVWQKPLQYCKVISFQLIKINENKIKTNIKINRFFK